MKELLDFSRVDWRYIWLAVIILVIMLVLMSPTNISPVLGFENASTVP